MKLTIFKQTIAVNSLYPFKSQWELFKQFLDDNSLLFLILLTIILSVFVVLLTLACKSSVTVESGLLRNFLIEGV